jgi:hypothetical protein
MIPGYLVTLSKFKRRMISWFKSKLWPWRKDSQETPSPELLKSLYAWNRQEFDRIDNQEDVLGAISAAVIVIVFGVVLFAGWIW